MSGQFSGVYGVTTPITDSYTVLVTDDAVAATITAAAKTITLYTPQGSWFRSSPPGGRVVIWNEAASTFPVTIATAAGTIVGPSVLSPGQVVTFLSDGGTRWIAESGSGLGTVQLVSTVSIPTASVLLLHTTPFSLIPTPGSGKSIAIDSISAKLTFNTIAYTGTNACEIRYTDGSGVKLTADITAAFINSAATAFYSVFGAAALPTLNAAVVAVCPVADPAAGNSPIVLTIRYRVLS